MCVRINPCILWPHVWPFLWDYAADPSEKPRPAVAEVRLALGSTPFC